MLSDNELGLSRMGGKTTQKNHFDAPRNVRFEGGKI
jgi:hypothetical protein